MILFLADIHIKLGQRKVPVEWAKHRFQLLEDEIINLCSKVDIVVIGGDTFDRVPNLAELEIFFSLVKRLTKPTYIYDGNHEATKKGQTFLSCLKSVVSLINPKVQIIDEVTELDFGTIVPYCKLKQKGVFEGLNKTKPLFTHVRGSIPPYVLPEIDLNTLSEFPIVYAGDLHSNTNCQLNIIYPGSPINTSFSRTEIKTGCIIIDKDTWHWVELHLPQLLKKTVTSQKEIVPTTYHHTLYELEAEVGNLETVENSDLLDKKITKRVDNFNTFLTKDMTVAEELAEYLKNVMLITSHTQISNFIRVFNEHTKNS